MRINANNKVVLCFLRAVLVSSNGAAIGDATDSRVMGTNEDGRRVPICLGA